MSMISGSHSKDQRQPVLSLLEKYSSLHQGIDQAREETTAVGKKLASAKAEMEEMREERAHNEHIILQKRKEQTLLEQQAEQAKQELIRVEHEHAAVKSKHDRAKLEHESVQSQIKSHRQEYLETSRLFRRNCKRLRMRAHLVGVGTSANMHAYFSTKQLNPDFELQDEFALQQNEKHKEMDAEIESTKRDCEAIEFAHAKAKHTFDEFESMYAELKTKADHRQSRKRQLEVQLERLNTDTTDLESEIESVRQTTAEARQMASNLEKYARQKQQKAVTPSPKPAGSRNSERNRRPINPYTKQSKAKQGIDHERGQAKFIITPPPPVQMEEPTDLSQQQYSSTIGWGQQQHRHAHQVGRVRLSRRFGSTVASSGTAYTPQPNAGLHSTNTSGSNRTYNNVPQSRPTNNGIIEDTSDDDELLSFVGLRKTSSKK